MTNPDASLVCRNCPCSRPAQLNRTSEQRDIALVLDWPTERESKRGWFAGKKGGGADLLTHTLEALGVDTENLYICSALNCRPNSEKQAQLRKAMESCRERLVTELREAGVKKVLCLGPIGYSSLTSAKTNLPITKVRGRWRKAFGLNVMATVSPGLVIVEPGFFRDFIFDLEKFFTEDGPKLHPEVDLWTPETLAELDECFSFIYDHSFHSCDLETSGFSPIDDTITAAGFGVITNLDTAQGVTVILDETILSKKRTWARIGELINSEIESVFHLAKFDLKFLKTYFSRHEIEYKPYNVYDTMLLHYCLDERSGESKFKCHDLETLARTKYDAPDYGIDIKKFLQEWNKANEYDREQMRHKLHIYLGLDCYYTARLFPDLWNKALAEDEGLLDLYENLLLPASNALTEIEFHGVLLDHDMYSEKARKLGVEAELYRRKVCLAANDPDFNPGSPKQVKELLFDKLGMKQVKVVEKGGARKQHHSRVFKGAKDEVQVRAVGIAGESEDISTSKYVLLALGQFYPEHKSLLNDILEYRNLKKMVSTYLDGLVKKCDSDKRLRGSFNLHGTETGRLSSSGPNLQNIPNPDDTGVNVREGFIAGKGKKLIEADYSQLEIRIAAELSGDPVMREACEKGDVHLETAQVMFQLPPDQIDSDMRFLGKHTLFGLIYGRGAESIANGPEQEVIEKKRGERWGVSEIQEFIENLLHEWSVFAEWQNDQELQGYSNGFVALPSGRKRRFPFIPKHDAGYVARASFNTPIQGTASDFTLYAVVKMQELLPVEAHVVLTVHDQIMVECPTNLAKDVARQMEHIMLHETLFPTRVPLAVKMNISDRWGGK